MKRQCKARRGLAFIIIFAVVLAVPSVAFATDVAVTADSTSVKVGDSVTLTVTVSAGHIAVADGVFTYDSALLSYVSGTGGTSDGHINMVSAQSGGSDSLTAVINFKAIGEGDAVINVTMKSVLGYDGSTLDTAEAGVSVSITANAASSPGEGESAPPLSLSQTGVPAENVLGASEPMYIWRSLSNLTLPSGFADRQVEYGGEYVNGAAVPDSEDIILLYLSGDTGDSAGYFIYNADKNTLYPYVTITSSLAEFTLLWPEETLEPPEDFTRTTVSWQDRDMPAWQAPGAGDGVYLVYARNTAGEAGFYLYDTEGKSVQRYMAQPTAAAAATEDPAAAVTEEPISTQAEVQKTDSGIAIGLPIFIAICAGGALLAAAVVVLAVLYARRNRLGAPHKIKVINTTGKDAGI